MMNYWITSDTHFGHDKLIEICGRPKNFSELVLKRNIKTVQFDDILIHLGDVCIGKDGYWNRRFTQTITCKKWLVKGNHDKRSDTWYIEHGWDFVSDRIYLKKFGKEIMFTHIPIDINGFDLNIHGHFHNLDHRYFERKEWARRSDKHILISLEYNNFMPLNLKNIISVYDKSMVKK